MEDIPEQDRVLYSLLKKYGGGVMRKVRSNGLQGEEVAREANIEEGS